MESLCLSRGSLRVIFLEANPGLFLVRERDGEYGGYGEEEKERRGTGICGRLKAWPGKKERENKGCGSKRSMVIFS